jgi:hypothetical protein
MATRSNLPNPISFDKNKEKPSNGVDPIPDPRFVSFKINGGRTVTARIAIITFKKKDAKIDHRPIGYEVTVESANAAVSAGATLTELPGTAKQTLRNSDVVTVIVDGLPYDVWFCKNCH